ncbi:acyltransferase family protein [Streptomyces griseicoloratus]|nr:acyltransferase [Streptomyces griseicoloratus]
MRFFAALLVFCFHASYENLFADPDAGEAFATAFSKAGWMGVSFFFVLSGFLLTWSARDKDTARGFWRRRLFKVYPNHLLTFAAALVLLAATGGPLTGALPNLLLIQAWIPDSDVILSVNPVAWSLSAEAAFYLAFPFLLTAVRLIRPRRLWWYAAGVVAAILAMPLLAQTLFTSRTDMAWLAIPEHHYWFVFAFPPVRALDFVLGILMAEIVRNGLWPHTGLLPAGAAVVAGYALALEVPMAYSMVAVCVIPFAWLITAAAVADIRGTASPFRSRTMVWLGEVSFAFYLLHRLVQIHGHRLLGADESWSTPAAIGLLVLGACLTLLLSWLVFAAFERPVMRRFGTPRRTPPTRPAPRPAAPAAAPAHAGPPGAPADGPHIPGAATAPHRDTTVP